MKISKLFSRISSIKGLFRNLIALSAGTSIQFLIQILTLPLFLYHVGVSSYATWLFAFSLAQVIGLLDFGSIASLQNSLSHLHFQGKFSEIDSSLKQVLNILLLGSFLFLLSIYCLDIFHQFSSPLKLVTLFVVSNLLQSSLGLLEAMSRINNKVAFALHFGNTLRLVEFMGTVIGIFTFHSSLLKIAALGVVFKFLFFILPIIKLSPRYRFLRFGWPEISKMFSCVKSGFPFLLVKISDLVTISGLLIVLNSKMTSRDFVVFSSARTFFRIGLQATALISHSYAYEMSRCWVTNDISRMKTLVRQSAKITFCLATLGSALYLLFGKWMFNRWINQQISLDKFTLLIGTLYAFLLSVNQNQKMKFYAVNFTEFVSYIQLSFSLGMVALVNFSGIPFKVATLFAILVVFEILNFLVINIFARGSIERYFLYTNQSKAAYE